MPNSKITQETSRIKSLFNHLFLFETSHLKIFYDTYPKQIKELEDLDSLYKEVKFNSKSSFISASQKRVLSQELSKIKGQSRKIDEDIENQRKKGFSDLLTISSSISEISKSERNLAEFMANLYNSSPSRTSLHKKKIIVNEVYKTLYCGAISSLTLNSMIANKFTETIYHYFPEFQTNYSLEEILIEDSDFSHEFNLKVRIPLIMSSLIKDIGFFSPQSLNFSEGNDNLVFDEDQRRKYNETKQESRDSYLEKGLGFYSSLEDKGLSGTIPRLTIENPGNEGNDFLNILTLSQIYSSFLFPRSFNRGFRDADISSHTAFKRINSHFRNSTNFQVVESFFNKVGYFPPGIGFNYYDRNKNSREIVMVNGFLPDKGSPKLSQCVNLTSGGMYVTNPTPFNLILPNKNVSFRDLRESWNLNFNSKYFF